MIRSRRIAVLPAASAFLSLVFGGCGRERAAPVGPSAPDTVAPMAPDTVVASIRITPSERTIGFLGTRFNTGAAALAADGTTLYRSNRDPGRFAWSSSAPEIASVSGDSILSTGGSTRTVTGSSDGTATITATSQGVTGSMTVTVRELARLAWSVPLEWSFPDAVAPILIGAGVAIGTDGTIYVGWNDSPAQTSHWYALSPQGGILWTVDLPGLTKWGMPAIEADGTLYFGASIGSAGSLVAVDPGGSIRWILDGLDRTSSSPALAPDGTIHVAAGRHVYAIDPQGEIRWTYEISAGTFLSSPAVASDGTIYVGGDDHALHAINRDGSPRWQFETGNLIRAPPSIGPDGAIYVPSDDGRLYAVDPDGSERWSVVVSRPPPGYEGSRASVSSPPSIGPDGAIYVLGRGLFAINPDGSIRWHFDSSTSGFRTTPLLGADGTVYLGSGVTVTALDPQGRHLWDYQPGTDALSGVYVLASPAIGADGTIIATSVSHTDGGTIHGIVETESANGGYAGSPWPTQRGDRDNSGRAGG
ncbi:MAG: PQQ-binding-like beta-propeller repeat protein [Chloroflexi bacterium]|nr:PQQ-binding-like beta-propeller repeat protein [Chloroflexota bacterium]